MAAPMETCSSIHRKQGNQNREDGNTEALWVWNFNLNDPLDGQGHEMSRAITGEYNLVRNGNMITAIYLCKRWQGQELF